MSKTSIDDIRHSLAHLLAMAVIEKDPDVKLGIGPVIDNGFYYDFEFSGKYTPSEENLATLEERMKKLVSENIEFSGKEIGADEGKEMFSGQPYKIELIDEFSGGDLTLTAYTSGNFTDLCKGGHIGNTKEINPDAFKLTHIAGAYWRGDESNKMLTRIYGVAFDTKKELDAYLSRREEAEKRDHRKLGRELDLFTFSPLVGSGLPLFTPKGTLMRDLIAERIAKAQEKFGFKKVWIPHVAKKDLYEKSGHWEKFKEDLFHVKGKSNAEFVIKPMNCPHHTQIYASSPKSYKDLPVRFMEFTTNYRDEQAGELLGLTRVRSLTQDDAHVFCSIDQAKQEIKNIVSVIKDFYNSLGMFEEGRYWVSLSVRDVEEKKNCLGSEENWCKAEDMLSEIAKEESLECRKVEGEAAFYGPKIDFMFKDALDREWQLATIQLDFVIPERFGLTYKDADNSDKTPVMIHRAVAGSLERFLGVIIEHFAGAFPLWLSPVQIWILPIGEKQNKYASQVSEKLAESGLRAELRDEDETLGKKIRAGKMQKIPYMLVIGEKEEKEKKVMVESRDNGQIGTKTLDELVEMLNKETK